MGFERSKVERALEACGGDFDSALEQLTQPAVPPTGALAKLKTLNLSCTQITDAGCATLASAPNSDALLALVDLNLYNIPASAAAITAVDEALAKSRARAAALPEI